MQVLADFIRMFQYFRKMLLEMSMPMEDIDGIIVEIKFPNKRSKYIFEAALNASRDPSQYQITDIWPAIVGIKYEITDASREK